MLSALYLVAIGILAVLAFTRHRIFVICGFYSFYALLTVLEQGTAPPRVGPVTVYRALYVILFLSIVARFLQDSNWAVQIRRWPLASYFLLFILIMASSFYSQTSHTFSAADNSTVWDIVVVLCLFWLAASQVQREIDLKIMAATTIAVSLVLSVWVIWNAAQLNFTVLRGGIEVNQNYVSQFVLLGGIPLVGLILAGKGWVRKLLYVAMLFCIILVGLILASRGMFLAFLAGIAWMMGWAARSLPRRTLVAMGVIMAVVFGLALLLPGGGSLVERFQGSDLATLNSRTLAWHQALTYFIHSGALRMIFGQGLNSPLFVLGSDPISNLLNYHNQYLEYTMEQGVSGLLAFLTFLWAVIRRVARSGHPLKPVMFGWLGLLLVGAMSGTSAEGQEFWIFLGVIAGVSALPDRAYGLPQAFLPQINPRLSLTPSGIAPAVPSAYMSALEDKPLPGPQGAGDPFLTVTEIQSGFRSYQSRSRRWPG